MSADRPVRVHFTPGWVFFTFLAALAILKGLRMPNRWAVTHYLFTYNTGFMKRALWGETLWRVFGTWTSKYFFLAAVGLVVFAVFVTLLVMLCRRVPETPARVPFLLVFLASPALSFAAHLVGYLDQIVYVTLLLVLVQRRSWALQVVSGIVLALVLPAVHEASIFWCLGLTALAVVAGPLARTRGTASRLSAGAAIAVLWLASTLVVINNGKVTTERADAIRDERTAFADTRPRQDAFRTLTVPLGFSLADMRVRWSDPERPLEMIYSLLVFGPAILALTVVALRRVRRVDGSAAVRRATAVLVVAAATGPLVLHVVAWDMHRWNALAAMNAGLAALVLLVASPSTATEAAVRFGTARLTTVAFAVCLWNIAADPVFFDAYVPQHPPFQYQIQFLKEAFELRDPALWVPRPGN